MEKENECKEKVRPRFSVYGIDLTVNNIDKDVIKQRKKFFIGSAVFDTILFGLNTAAAVLMIKYKDELDDPFENGMLAGANIVGASCSVGAFISDISTIRRLRELEKYTFDTAVEEPKNIEPTVDDPDSTT